MRDMLATIRAHASTCREALGRDQLDQKTLEAIERVPRHEFVPAELASQAYEDRPLPIGHGQTISQPFIVALMTDVLNLDQHSTVLEIGCGCGYQTAVLAELAARVYAIEIVPELATRARETLERLGYDNVEIRAGDGYRGWPEAVPFDAIITAAASPDVPPPLLVQLAAPGRMVLPVGRPGGTQELCLVTKDQDGAIARRDLLAVRFVPLTGDH